MHKAIAISLVLILASIEIYAAAPRPGDWARYSMFSARRNGAVAVKSLTLLIGPTEGKLCWWQLEGVKTDDSTYSVRVLSQRVPMAGKRTDIGRVERYLFKDGNGPFIEYLEKSTGAALLPQFDFEDHLVPQPSSGATMDGPFPTSGGYIGNPIHLTESGSGKLFPAAGIVKALSLDPDLIIGTGRSFRDIDEGRVTDRNYNYREFTQEEYEEMEKAGVNFFLMDDAREAWVCERPVFYNKYPSAADFPDILYRSNYRGCVMFMDEPAVLMFLEEPQVAAARPPMLRPTDAANLVRFRVADQYRNCPQYSSAVLANHLRKTGVDLGVWDLEQTDVPSWETLYQTAYYQMESGATAVVHEGRYHLEQYNAELKQLMGEDVTVTSEQMLQLHYAFLRGAARCFDKDWGTSIYGQADPALSPLAMSMAYDMGARYLWYWTSDHTHHMPYAEQLELTRKIREHEKAHPRESPTKLRRKARVAVAFPEGYTYFVSNPWNCPSLTAEGLNETGVAHRKVIATAMREGIRLAKEGAAFDFVVDGEPVRQAGYRQVIRIGLDATVRK